MYYRLQLTDILMNTHLSTIERVVVFSLLLLLGITSRFLPHPPDMTALTAVIFASALYLGPRLSIILTVLLLVLSDVFIGSYEMPVMISVYGAFLLIAGIGVIFARLQKIEHKALILVSASVVFFLITNAAVWYFTPWYSKDLTGLMTSYTLGLPFLKNMLVGDFFYTPALLLVLAAFRYSYRVTTHSAYAS